VVPFMFGENVMSRRERVGVPSYECRLLLLGLKRTELLMLSRYMDLLVNWTISIFWSLKTGRAHI